MNFRVVFKTADKGVEFYTARKMSGILKTAYFFAVRRQIGSAALPPKFGVSGLLSEEVGESAGTHVRFFLDFWKKIP